MSKPGAHLRSKNETRLSEVLQRTYGGFVPTTLSVLIHASEAHSAESPGICSAVCLQFPVYAKAQTPHEAASILLANLVGYLENCEQQEAFAPCMTDPVHQAAFERGSALSGLVLDARISESLMQKLGQFDIQYRDVSELQKRAKVEAGVPSIQSLFGQFAA